ncbi:ISNCY family transposase, partial [Nostoc sp. WHI]|nr:ISNCY family transposase [Nostoc sp. WHI]MBG1271064.1 ISNCY family transposase [Nostoc sp. WHI]
QKVRDLLATRTSFFNDIRTLLKFICFKNWSEFFLFILTEYVPLTKVNSS